MYRNVRGLLEELAASASAAVTPAASFDEDQHPDGDDRPRPDEVQNDDMAAQPTARPDEHGAKGLAKYIAALIKRGVPHYSSRNNRAGTMMMMMSNMLVFADREFSCELHHVAERAHILPCRLKFPRKRTRA